MIQRRALWLVAASAVLLACGVGRPVHYYSLSELPPSASDPSPDGPAILVGRIATPQALQDGRVRYRAGANEVGSYEYHRWTDPPGIMVHDALIHSLRASGRYRTVQEAGSSAEGDYILRGKLLEFSEIDSPAVATRVSLDLELREVKTGRLVWNRLLTHDEPSQAKEVRDVVRSLDQNLQQVLKEAAASLGEWARECPHGPAGHASK